MGKISIRRTGILVGIFVLGVGTGYLLTNASRNSVLKNDTINNAVNKPTTAVTTNNKVELKKNKGSLVFAPTTKQSYCDSLLQVFIDTTSIRQFRKEKKRLELQ
ncbi:hypothetical protein L0P88_04055 [Muricauda sp. SCSIO 64092]|uniref:hypothetical protein n=1 Tax=Allomuricauda sp. SCSIO 64092 TaxID=2908842 RepID=UPI001FF3AD99|nr:hypothetical protein [Muricauda sp. SCSIO 64092]UOY07728.1 hypothetical protein L0P88_04055 [Muricauda sp. SCSIO 64092]